MNAQIDALKSKISDTEDSIEELESMVDPENPNSYTAQLQTIAASLAFSKFFTDGEYAILREFFIE